MPVAEFADVSYVDDGAFCNCDDQAAHVARAVPKLVGVVTEVCHTFGFSVIFCICEAEGVVAFTRPLSRMLRGPLFIHQAGVVECNACCGCCQLRLAHVRVFTLEGSSRRTPA